MLHQRAVTRSTRGHHHMVYRFGQTVEEPPQGRGVGGVERGSAPAADLSCCLVQPVRIAAGENDLRAL